MIKEILDVLGIIGVGVILAAYFGVQSNRIKYNDMIYPVMNLCGSILILGSLYLTPNIPSIVIEVAWLMISIYGIIMVYKGKLKKE